MEAFAFMVSIFVLMIWVGALKTRNIDTFRLFLLPVGMSYSAIYLGKQQGWIESTKMLGVTLLHGLFPFLFTCALYIFSNVFIGKEKQELTASINHDPSQRPIWGLYAYFLCLLLYMIFDLQTWTLSIDKASFLFKFVPFFLIVILGAFVSIPFIMLKELDKRNRRIHTLVVWRRNSLVLTGVVVCGATILFFKDTSIFDYSFFSLFLYSCIVYITCTGLLIQNNFFHCMRKHKGLIGLVVLFIFCIFWSSGIGFIDVKVNVASQNKLNAL